MTSGDQNDLENLYKALDAAYRKKAGEVIETPDGRLEVLSFNAGSTIKTIYEIGGKLKYRTYMRLPSGLRGRKWVPAENNKQVTPDDEKQYQDNIARHRANKIGNKKVEND